MSVRSSRTSTESLPSVRLLELAQLRQTSSHEGLLHLLAIVLRFGLRWPRGPAHCADAPARTLQEEGSLPRGVPVRLFGAVLHLNSWLFAFRWIQDLHSPSAKVLFRRWALPLARRRPPLWGPTAIVAAVVGTVAAAPIVTVVGALTAPVLRRRALASARWRAPPRGHAAVVGTVTAAPIVLAVQRAVAAPILLAAIRTVAAAPGARTRARAVVSSLAAAAASVVAGVSRPAVSRAAWNPPSTAAAAHAAIEDRHWVRVRP
mmetsp:Transcript_66962/g.186964  ORF Transcript_66962/g.186964 Transcript_66962/m.186964 type:complete len:261 (+) Transcript_66962:83-865(+)